VPTTLVLVFGILVVAVVGFVVLWVAICYAIAVASGWRRLLPLYGTGPFAGSTSSVAGYLGPSRYRGKALIVGASATGLYLNVVAIFRIGAGPVLIPWQDVAVSPPSADPPSLVTFDFPKARTRLRLREDVARKLLEWRRDR
jgi:hypothetical protein